MLHKVIAKGLEFVPKPVLSKIAGRYIAGETLEDELRELERVKAVGFKGIFDILGEHVRDADEARESVLEYIKGAEAIAKAGLDAYISIKPTHVGLLLDEALAAELYEQAVTRCAELGLLLRVEMEDHPTTDATLRIFEDLRTRHDNVGIVLQARLFRTLDDIEKMAEGKVDVRLVKGIYIEPAAIAHTRPEPIRQAFVTCTQKLVDRGAHVRFGTHDALLAERLIRIVKERALTTEDYEFQVLLGVQEHLWSEWQTAGHPVRVYVPFGPEWKAYSLRRLSKNPQLLIAVTRGMFTRR